MFRKLKKKEDKNHNIIKVIYGSKKWQAKYCDLCNVNLPQTYTKADLKISQYVLIHIKIISWKCFNLNSKNYRVIHL